MAEREGSARVLGTALIVFWAAASGVVAVTALPDVNADAMALVVGASIVGLAASITAALLLSRGSVRAAGLLLAMSALVTPTYAAAFVNLVPLLAGIVMVVVGERSSRRRDVLEARRQ